MQKWVRIMWHDKHSCMLLQMADQVFVASTSAIATQESVEVASKSAVRDDLGGGMFKVWRDGLSGGEMA